MGVPWRPRHPSGTTGLQTVDTILCKISSAAIKPVFKHDCRIICIKYSTDDGRVKVISEIFYGQYQIWELFESCMFLGLKTKIFCRNKLKTQNHGQRTHSAKMGTLHCTLAENTQNHSTYFDLICLPKPKILGFSKKNLSGCSSV